MVCLGRCLLVAILSSCHPTTALDVPPIEPGSQSQVLIVTGKDDFLIAYALEVTSGAATYPAFTRPDEIDLYTVDFKCSLEVLGIERGRLALLDEPSERLELPRPLGVSSSHDGAEQRSWSDTELDSVESILRRIRLPEANLCRLYGVGLGPVTPGFVVGTSTPTLIAPLPDGTAMVANTDGTFHSVDFDHQARELSYISRDAPRLAAYLGEGDRMYVVGRDGTLARGQPLSDDFEVIFTGGATLAARAQLSGAPDGSEMFRASSAGYFDDERTLRPQNPLERFDGVRWSALTEGRADQSQHGSYDVIWVSPGEAFATGVVPAREVTHYRHGMATNSEDVDREALEAIANIPGVGLIVATTEGVIARRTTQWIIDPDSDLPGLGGARVLIPIDRGFLYGRTQWASWDPIAGYCIQRTQTPPASRGIAMTDRGFLMMTFGLDNDDGSSLFTLERNDVEDPCLDK